MPFRNLYLQLASFRDHNFSDFLGRLEDVTEEFLEDRYHKAYFEGRMDSYFEPIIPLTLHPAACAGFFRTSPRWPITERDYYLSKLFQFLFPPIQIKYEIDYDTESKVTDRLESILDQIPDEVSSELYRWNWWDFYYDTFQLKLEPLLERLSERLQEFCRQVTEGLPVQGDAEPETQRQRRRRRRQPETVERDSIIVHCHDRGMERHEICRILDQKGVPTTKGLQAKGFYRWAKAFTNPEAQQGVQSIFSKALKKQKLVKRK